MVATAKIGPYWADFAPNDCALLSVMMNEKNHQDFVCSVLQFHLKQFSFPNFVQRLGRAALLGRASSCVKYNLQVFY